MGAWISGQSMPTSERAAASLRIALELPWENSSSHILSASVILVFCGLWAKTGASSHVGRAGEGVSDGVRCGEVFVSLVSCVCLTPWRWAHEGNSWLWVSLW